MNGFAPNSQERRVWSLARTTLKVKVNFGSLRAVYVWKNIFAIVNFCSTAIIFGIRSTAVLNLPKSEPSSFFQTGLRYFTGRLHHQRRQTADDTLNDIQRKTSADRRRLFVFSLTASAFWALFSFLFALPPFHARSLPRSSPSNPSMGVAEKYCKLPRQVRDAFFTCFNHQKPVKWRRQLVEVSSSACDAPLSQLHPLHPRSRRQDADYTTQPPILRGTVNEYQLSGWVEIINGDGGCGWQQPTGGLTVHDGWLGLRFGGHLALSLHSSDEPGELSQWPRRDDSTVIICHCCCYYCVTVEEMDKNDEELRESIAQLWPIQGPKMNTILVPPKDGTCSLLLLPSTVHERVNEASCNLNSTLLCV